MSRRQFTPEFKQEAVKLVLEHDRSATAVAVAVAVAPELVIAQRSVSAWVQKAHAAPSASVSLSGPERRELCALRRWQCCWICIRAGTSDGSESGAAGAAQRTAKAASRSGTCVPLGPRQPIRQRRVSARAAGAQRPA